MANVCMYVMNYDIKENLFTLGNLKTNILNLIAMIPFEMCEKVNVDKKTDYCNTEWVISITFYFLYKRDVQGL